MAASTSAGWNCPTIASSSVRKNACAWPISLTDSTTSTALRSAFANGIADRIERDEAVMAQVRNQSEGQVMHGLFPKKVPDAVLYDLSDHEKQSMPLQEDEGGDLKPVCAVDPETFGWRFNCNSRTE